MNESAATAASRDAKELSRRAFDVQAATYDDDMRGEHARKLYPSVLDEVTGAAPSRVLDMGCGTGALAQLVIGALPHCELVGIDLSSAMLERSRQRLGQRADLHQADSEHLPFPDESFDVAYCNDSFHHYPDPRRAAFEAWRVLRPGGVLVVGDCWLPAPARAVMNVFMPYGGEGDVRIYSGREMRDILGTWFGEVSWKRRGFRACVARAVK